ncbi:hypothetical protein LshimejAT787_2200810 [Lyophyllum shimeji]|uniref:Uncharacterized protein n=1 Tax=Lyophyllum shimeji TaxID=47721 RepID=A0A9P3Q0J7_LYOSH|nr:hypothetical protein LshimejAT787_2200810 [Lyophyllum shimeji]
MGDGQDVADHFTQNRRPPPPARLRPALSGAATPLFSFLLSLLLLEVSTGGHNTALINCLGGLVLGIVGLDGVLIGLKYCGMESAALAWITVTMARNLVTAVAGHGVLMACMLGLGLVWAMARGWEFTLVGLGIAPMFAGVMAVQTMLGGGVRDAGASGQGRRWRGLIMRRGRFEEAAEKALRTGGAPAVYVGVVLTVKGRYAYLQMVEALNLVVFAVTVRLAAHGIHPKKIAKPSDSTGSLRPIFANEDGIITFSSVQLTYPSRPDVPCSAVPTSPSPRRVRRHRRRLLVWKVHHGGRPGAVRDVLRHARVEETTATWSRICSRQRRRKVSKVDIRKAAQAANIHDFVMGLQHGYGTLVGENAGLIPGGQVLETDECTSAHDPEDQRAVPDVIGKMKTAGGAGRSTATATHNSEVTKMCDRMLGLADGMVKEEGRFEELVRRKGVFATPRSRAEYIAEVPQATDEHGARVVRLFPPAGHVLSGFGGVLRGRSANSYFAAHKCSCCTSLGRFLPATAASFKEASWMVDTTMPAVQRMSRAYLIIFPFVSQQGLIPAGEVCYGIWCTAPSVYARAIPPTG